MADPGPHTTYLPLQCVTVQVTDTVKHQVYNQMRSFLSGFEHKHSCNPTLNHWQSDSSVTRHRRVWNVLKKVKLFYWSLFSFFFFSAASAELRAAVRYRRRPRAGEAADTRRQKGLREVGGFSGTVRGAGCVCHQCRELPPSNKGWAALLHPGSAGKSSKSFL